MTYHGFLRLNGGHFFFSLGFYACSIAASPVCLWLPKLLFSYHWLVLKAISPHMHFKCHYLGVVSTNEQVVDHNLYSKKFLRF